MAQRQTFMHNGFFKNLRDVVSFYASRNSDPKRWYGPGGLANDLPLAPDRHRLRSTPSPHAPATQTAGELIDSQDATQPPCSW